MRQAFGLFFAALLILADQVSKWFVTEFVVRSIVEAPAPKPLGLVEWFASTPAPLPFAETSIFSFLNIVMVWNKGISFGLFNQATDYGPIMLIVLSFVITIWFLIWLFRTQDRSMVIGLSMIIGGALGNVIDRIRFGAVIDFIDFHIGDWHFPAFNVADSCIVLGVFFLMIYSIFFEKSLHHQDASV